MDYRSNLVQRFVARCADCDAGGVSAGFLLAHASFRGRRVLISTFNTLLALPAVVVGLTVYMLLSRNGPLGDLKLLFTQSGMVIGQFILCFPLLVAVSHSALQAADRRAWETAITLGANPWQAMLSVMYEVRYGLIAALIASFGRVIAEVGSSMMIGGNILNYTRNITTAIALETSKGAFAQGIALGIILLLAALLLNFGLTLCRAKARCARERLFSIPFTAQVHHRWRQAVRHRRIRYPGNAPVSYSAARTVPEKPPC